MAGGDLSDFEAEFGAPKPVAAPEASAPTASNSGNDLRSFEREFAPQKAAVPGRRGGPGGGPAPAPVTPHGTFGEVASGAAKNFLPDLYQTGSDIVSAVAHPVKTAKGIYDIGAGVGSKLGFGDQSPQAKAKAEAAANAVGADYADAYGSWDKFKNTMATHPVRPLMDASTLLGVGEATLPARAAKLAGAAARTIDPIQTATRAALKVASVPQSLFSATPGVALRNAAKYGYERDPAVRKAFTSQYTGSAPADNLPEAVRQASKKIEKGWWDEYNQGKDKILSGASQPVDLSGVNSAVARAKGNLAQYHPDMVPQATHDAVTAVENLVNDWSDPAKGHLRTAAEVDKLRNRVGDIMATDSAHLKPYLRPVYEQISDALENVAPGIREHYKLTPELKPKIKDLLIQAGANPSLSNASAIIKQLRLLRTAKGQDILSQLAKADPKIPAMLSGKALHPWMPESGLIHAFGTMAGGAGLFELAHNPAMWPLLAKGAVGTGLSASPKIAGAIQYATSRAAHSPLEKGAYYAGKHGNQPVTDSATDVNYGSNSDADRYWHNILRQESGNKQFNRDGTPRRSKKGAWGAAQVMESTLGEAAARAGEKPDLQRLKYDTEYNKKVGRAYYDSLVERFGDPRIAAAAYNAGPTAVQRAIYQAGPNGDWLGLLPQETKEYVPNVAREEYPPGDSRNYPAALTVHRATGGRTGFNHEAEAASLVRRAETIKKGLGKTTEPLLNASDAHIAQALSVANESI